MSAQINIYSNNLSDNIIPTILRRLNEHETVSEISPAFSFKNSNGSLQIVFKCKNSSLELFENKNLKLNFCVNIKPFNLQEYKRKIMKRKIMKQTFLEKIFSKKKKKKEAVVSINSSIETQLKKFNWVLTLQYYPGNVFEQKHATLICAIITELTSGVCHFTFDNTWYNHQNVMDECLMKVYDLDELPDHININLIAVAS